MILTRVGRSHRKGLHSGRKAARLSCFARGSFGNSSSTRPLGRRCFARCSGVGRYTPAMKGGLCLSQKRSIFPIQSTKLSASSSWRAFPITKNSPTPSRITACLSFGLKRMRLSLEIANHPLAPTLCNQTSSDVRSSANSSSCFTTRRPASDKMRGNRAPRSRSAKNITLTLLVRRLQLLPLPAHLNHSLLLCPPQLHPRLYGQQSPTWKFHVAR